MLDDVLLEPVRPPGWMGRDDDLVSAEETQRILHGLQRIRVADLALCLHSLIRERGERGLEALLGELSGMVFVRRPVAKRRVERWTDDEHIGVRRSRPLDDLASQRSTGDRLVGDDEDLLALAGTSAVPLPDRRLHNLGVTAEVAIEDDWGEHEEGEKRDPAVAENPRHRDRREKDESSDDELEGLCLGPHRIAHGRLPPT
jgi:hypothetical protein